MRGLHGAVVCLALSLLLCIFPPVLGSAAGQTAGQSRPGVIAPTGDRRASGTGILKVRVTSFSGAPLRRAVVRLEGQGAAAATDPDGRADITSPAGRWVLTATREGYLTMRSGQRTPRELPRPFVIEPGQTLTVALQLPRCGVLGGRVTDEMGEPLPNVRVRALRSVYVQGRHTIVPTGEAVSNAAGLYSVAGLVPGTYTLIGARLGETPSGDATFAPAYYPGTWDAAQASPIDLGLEQELSGLDFRLMPARVARLTGTMLDSRGRFPTEGSVTLYERIAGDPRDLREVMVVPIGSSGTFSFWSVPPGDYILRGSTFSPTLSPNLLEFAALSLSVNQADLSGIALRAGMGGNVVGTVEVDGQAGTAGIPGFSLVAVANDGSGPSGAIPPPTALVRAVSRFQLGGLAGPILIRAVGLPPEWVVKSVSIGGRDCTDAPYDFRGNETVSARVVITNRVTEVTGIVTDDRGHPAADYAVVVFPADRHRWGGSGRSMQAARPDQQGRFSIKGLPAGDYVAAVSVGLDEGEWTNPDFLEQLAARATPFTLDDGVTKTLDLKLPRGTVPDSVGAGESKLVPWAPATECPTRG